MQPLSISRESSMHRLASKAAGLDDLLPFVHVAVPSLGPPSILLDSDGRDGRE